MVSKALLLAVLAACGVQPSTEATAQEPPGDVEEPPDEIEDGHNFCCASIDLETGKGEGCTYISEQYTALCDKVLYCAGSYAKDGDTVKCVE